MAKKERKKSMNNPLRHCDTKLNCHRLALNFICDTSVTSMTEWLLCNLPYDFSNFIMLPYHVKNTLWRIEKEIAGLAFG